jgi:hypothetical protein
MFWASMLTDGGPGGQTQAIVPSVAIDISKVNSVV